MKPTDFLFRHTRIGYITILLVADTVCLGFCLADLIRCWHEGCSAITAIVRAPELVRAETWWVTFKVLVLTGIAFPIYIGIVRVLWRAVPALPGHVDLRRRTVAAVHGAMWILIIAMAAVGQYMEVLSGFVVTHGNVRLAFSSWSYSLVSFLSSNTSFLLGLLASFLAPFVLNILLRHRTSGSGLSDYEARVYLFDLGVALYPTHGPGKANFNAASVSPEIRLIKKLAEQTVKEYQRRIPGSDAGRRYLIECAQKCREMLRRVAGAHLKAGGFDVELFPGSSRALEVAISRMAGPHRLVVSPYEHPSERDVVDWMQSVSAASVWKMSFDSDDFEKP